MGAHWTTPRRGGAGVVELVLLIVAIVILVVLAVTAVAPDMPANSVDPFVDCAQDDLTCGPMVPDPGGAD